MKIITDIKSRWENLAERERTILTIGSVLLGIFLLYALIWNPLSNAAMNYKNKVQSQQNLLHYLKTSLQHILRLKAQGIGATTATSNGNILAMVEQSVSSRQLSSYLKQVQQPQPNSVTLTFENVSFDTLMAWLENLTDTQHLSIQSFSATRLSTGMANVTMTLVQ